MASYSDDFNRANGPLGANWTVNTGTFDIFNNLCRCSSGNNSAFWNAASLADSFSECVSIQVSIGSNYGPACRLQNTSGLLNGYAVWCYNPFSSVTSYLYRFVDNVSTQLGSSTTGANSPARIEVAGNHIKAYKSGTVFTETDDFTFASGYVGITGTGGTCDSWSAGDLGGGDSVQVQGNWRLF
jgi:hypothetical protein